MTDWIAHNTGKRPTLRDTFVIVKYGSGERKTGPAHTFDWTIAGGKCGAVADIIEYQIVDAGAAATDWIEWSGGECPVAEGALITVELRRAPGDHNNYRMNSKAPEVLRWAHEGNFGDIVAYRLVDAPGASTGAQEVSPANSALSQQVAGTHYKECKIQPVEFSEANKLQYLEGSIVARAARHDKATGKGAEDIRKIIHEAQLLLQLRYGEVA